ncbi:MAG: ATP-binding protein [Oscillospiraceae bacterium]|nr:ATP-binding protein [Oscillospiraceae bacterium]
MAYSKELYEKALTQIKKRRADAEKLAEERKAELEEKCPDLKYINKKLMNTGNLIVKALSAKSGEEVVDILLKLRKDNIELNKEKKAILTAMGLPEDYLDVHYTCEKCSDTGFYEERDEIKGVSYGTKLCSCHIDMLKKLASEEMSMQTPLELSSFDDFDLSYYKNDKETLEQMKYIFKTCVSYSQNFDLDSPSLLFYGRTGLGKTHLSLSIANEIIHKGFNVIYGSVNNFFAKIEYEKFNKGNDTYTLDLLCSADLLILDDLGMEFATPFTNSALYTVINTRICRNLPTIISTNLSPDELRDKYHESIVSRIVGTFETLEFLGKDIRQSSN